MSIHVTIKVIPLGVGPSISRYVAEAVRVLRDMGYKPLVGPADTSIEVGSLEDVGRILRRIHDTLAAMGAPRILTIVSVDDRRDKDVPLEYKIDKVGRLAGVKPL